MNLIGYICNVQVIPVFICFLFCFSQEGSYKSDLFFLLLFGSVSWSLYICPMNIYEKLVDIQGRLKAPKNQYNSFGKYKYRNCEDILEAVKPLLVEHKVVLTISDKVIELDNGLSFVESTAQFKDIEGVIEVSAQAGIDPNKKGMDVAQCFGSSSSYARKYALNGLFLIDDTKDADSANNHNSTNLNTSKVKEIIDDKKWLPEYGEAFDRAKEALKDGFTMNDIRKKYKVNKKVEQLLNT